MKQIKLTLDLETRRKVPLELGIDTTRELVLLIAQAIVAVHLGAREVQRADATREDDDVHDD